MEIENNAEAFEPTTVQSEASAEQGSEEQDIDTTQAMTEEASGESSEKIQNAEAEVFLPIRYNHEDMILSREEAVKYAQLGKLYSESVKPIFNSLEYIAAQRDITVAELVDGIMANDEEEYRKELEDKFGADNAETIEDLLQVRRNKQKEKYEKVLENQKTNASKEAEAKQQRLESRLADGFRELKAEFPEIAEYKDLPNEVKAEAIKGRDLLSAYLRHKYSEDKRIMAAKKTADENSRATTGSGSSYESAEDGATTAFLKGLWS